MNLAGILAYATRLLPQISQRKTSGEADCGCKNINMQIRKFTNEMLKYKYANTQILVPMRYKKTNTKERYNHSNARNTSTNRNVKTQMGKYVCKNAITKFLAKS